MNIDYETLKTKLAECSNLCYDSFHSKIVSNYKLNISFKDLISNYNSLFQLVNRYIELIVNNEITKIKDVILFFENGFEYLDNSKCYNENDIKDFLSNYLQMLVEAYTEYNFLYTGKAFVHAHRNDLLFGGGKKQLHVKFDRSRPSLVDNNWFDEPNLKGMKNTLMVPNLCTLLSYHSLYLMFHVTEAYLKRFDYSGKLKLDYNSIEKIDDKLDEFKKFLKEQVNTKFIYFMKKELSVKVKISCGMNCLIDEKDNCLIEYCNPKVIIYLL